MTEREGAKARAKEREVRKNCIEAIKARKKKKGKNG